jgi:hypothetical protein
MKLIARNTSRTRKKLVVDPDKLLFSVAETCALLGYSSRTIIGLFEDEPGVLIRRHPEKMHKRGRRIIRIPRAVYLRVRGKLAA